MSDFYQLFLSASGRAPAAIIQRLTQAASVLFAPRAPRGPGRAGPAPPAFLGHNRLRQDLGLPAVDRDGRPI